MNLKPNSASESNHEASQSIPSALVSAFLEWMLMFMIFIDASFAYLVTRFARHHQLRVPCLLCSRLDHILGNERAGFYWGLICHEHKSKLSSLVLSQIRNNLVDESSHRHNNIGYRAIDNGGTEHDEPPSINDMCSVDVAREIMEKSAELHQMKKDGDRLPHVAYSQINDNSDNESLSDSEGASPLIREMETSCQESVSPAGDSKEVAGQSERICFTDVHPSPNQDGTHSIHSNQKNDATSTIELEKEVHIDCRETSNLGSGSTDELRKQVKTDSQENSKVGSYSIPQHEIQTDSKPNKTETNSQMASSLDLGDAYRLAVGTRGRQLSGKLEQNRSITDRVSEDLKLLLSQISAPRGLDLPSAEMSPKLSANNEDFPRRISLERNESNLSIDGSIVGEIEGESEVDRLRRQVEHDKRILVSLYKELEEERNASAIAANQAMAMITRLQEEKAAFHMEALQCVRMMEEQAEYDGEALQKANLLLAEKEKQIQDFQFELEIHRNGFGDVPSSNNSIKPYEADELEEHTLVANCGYDYLDPDINKDDIVKRIDGAAKMRKIEDEK